MLLLRLQAAPAPQLPLQMSSLCVPPENNTEIVTHGVFTLMFVLIFLLSKIISLRTGKYATSIGLHQVGIYTWTQRKVISTQITGRGCKGIYCSRRSKSKYYLLLKVGFFEKWTLRRQWEYKCACACSSQLRGRKKLVYEL